MFSLLENIIYYILALCVYIWLFSSRENENKFVKIVIQKTFIFWYGVGFMIYSKDNKGIGPKYNPDPDNIKDIRTESKRIIFLRHGESDWNDVFNKGINLGIFTRLAKALWEEFFLLPHIDSKFIDSPLNMEGVAQALELRRFIESAEHPECSPLTQEFIDILRGGTVAVDGNVVQSTTASSVVVSSSLRRSIATTTLALWPRVERRKEKIHILNCLQEISRNIDTQSLAPPKEVADLPNSRLLPHCKSTDPNFNLTTVFDATENFGNKTRSFYAIKRLRAFNEWVFKREEDTIVVGGHSLWFKYFFQTYLPFKFDHEAKNKKITNSGAVAFTIYRSDGADGNSLYRIDPDSLRVLYGGFTAK